MKTKNRLESTASPFRVHPRRIIWPIVLMVVASLSLWACARREAPSFYEQMLTGMADESGNNRVIQPELWLSCSTSQAEVLLDGVLQGLCGDFQNSGLPLSEGPHDLEVRLPGYLPYVATLEAGRARMTLAIDLVKIR